MTPILDFPHLDNIDRRLRWNRFERADRFQRYIELQAQGVSQRQAAKQLQVPRTTLQAWRRQQSTLDICPHVAQFFQSELGLAFLHRLILALHLVFVEVGASGIRLVCLLLKLSGLDRFVAASYGAQQQVNRRVEEAIIDYDQTETSRLATDMPQKDITLTKDETFTGGLCLVGMEPVSNFIILEQLAQARDQTTWNDLLAPALAQLNCRVIQSTSDEAPGLLAYVEHYLGAHHSPDLFHVQYELTKAVSAPLATKVRAAQKVVTEAQQRLEQVQEHLKNANDESAEPKPVNSNKETVNVEQAQQDLDIARQEHERMGRQREQVRKGIRAIGQAYHVVDLERGVRRNGALIAADLQQQLDQIRAIAEHEGLSEPRLEQIYKAERVIPKMQATIEFVSGYIRQQVDQLDLTPPASHTLHARLIPSYYLDRVAQRRSVAAGAPLRELAKRLRAPLVEPGGALHSLSPDVQDQLHQKAKTLADVFQHSSSNVEGRNGYLSLRNHQLRGLDLPRKRKCLTAIHNFFLTRSDGTTAAERFFGQKPRSLFVAILESVELPPAPLSPPRKA